MKLITNKADDQVHFAEGAGVHVLEKESIDALNTALAADRPLLIRGEPGVGKSQLARAAAQVLGRVYIAKVVDSRTEAQDLLWHFDAVARLAEAQMASAICDGEALTRLRSDLDVGHFVRPGPLWWAFRWSDACGRCPNGERDAPKQWDGGRADKGAVLLIDEIDKAETDVPNGLLEALGVGQFTPPGQAEPVQAREPRPLVIVTSNEERTLPDAFVRRCFVLHLALPSEEDALIERLVKRGRAHFESMDEKILEKAARQLAGDRMDAQSARRRPLPGQAEYLDILRALSRWAPDDTTEQLKLLKRISGFALKKHQGVG